MTEICPACGKPHDELAFGIPVSLPTRAAAIPEPQRNLRVWSSGELCVVDEEHFYIYGCIELAVFEHPQPFIWGAWAEVDEDIFFDYQDLMNLEGRQFEEAFNAVLGTDIPFYPPTLGLPISVHVQPRGTRPLFLLMPSSHPLASDQRDGISAMRVLEIKSWFMALSGNAA